MQNEQSTSVLRASSTHEGTSVPTQPASQPLATAVLGADDLVKINEAVGTLHDYGFNMAQVMTSLADRLDEQSRQPDEYDQAWPLLEAPALKDLIAEGNYRSVLGQRLKVGRAYSLSPGQRDVLREQFGLTPAQYVEITELATFSNTQFIRRVTLRNVEHVDTEARVVEGRGWGAVKGRKHLLTRFSINFYGKFLADSLANDAARGEENRLNKFDARIVRLVERAKEAKVSHGITLTRGVANEFMAACDELRLDLPTPENDTGQAVRDVLRDVLARRKEYNLVELVKEPSLFAVGKPKAATKPTKSQEELMEEYAI